MIWDRLTNEEKQWITAMNFTEETVNSHDVEDTRIENASNVLK